MHALGEAAGLQLRIRDAPLALPGLKVEVGEVGCVRYSERSKPMPPAPITATRSPTSAPAAKHVEVAEHLGCDRRPGSTACAARRRSRGSPRQSRRRQAAPRLPRCRGAPSRPSPPAGGGSSAGSPQTPPCRARAWRRLNWPPIWSLLSKSSTLCPRPASTVDAARRRGQRRRPRRASSSSRAGS